MERVKKSPSLPKFSRFLAEYDPYSKVAFDAGRNEGRNKGRNEGTEIAERRLCLALLEAGTSISEISLKTKLSVSYIERLLSKDE